MRILIETLGCPKNAVDSEMMGELLRQEGHVLVQEPERADVLVVNTCGFVAAARDESLDVLRGLARAKSSAQRLIAAGCWVERDSAGVRALVPDIDAVVGTRSWPQIVSIVRELEAGASPAERIGAPFVALPPVARRGSPSAYLKIADGCDASCAFCAIPAIKGPRRSKPREQVLHEARDLVAGGAQEITLIAQSTTAYGRDVGLRDGLPPLLEVLCRSLPSLPWLRLLYAYPGEVSRRLIETMANHAQICHYLDIPLQHGHPGTLRRMGRPSDIEAVLALLDALRQAMPDVAIRSTFIVGYPGETEIEFAALLDLLSEARLDNVGMFAYSAEEGTQAAELPGRVPAEVVASRYERAMTHQQELSRVANRAQVGRELDVLVEGVGDGLSVGRCYRQAPEVDGLTLVPGELSPGTMCPVRIVQADVYDLVGQILGP